MASLVSQQTETISFLADGNDLNIFMLGRKDVSTALIPSWTVIESDDLCFIYSQKHSRNLKGSSWKRIKFTTTIICFLCLFSIVNLFWTHRFWYLVPVQKIYSSHSVCDEAFYHIPLCLNKIWDCCDVFYYAGNCWFFTARVIVAAAPFKFCHTFFNSAIRVSFHNVSVMSLLIFCVPILLKSYNLIPFLRRY